MEQLDLLKKRRGGVLTTAEAVERPSAAPGLLDLRSEHDAAISRLSVDTLRNLVDDVYEAAFTREAWLGRESPGCESPDIEFRSMCRLLQNLALFRQLRYAVRYGDIGLIERLVDPLAVMFASTGQHKYAQEMLHLRWLLSDAVDPVLRKAVLAAGLVNETGKPDGFKPIDLALEHVNCCYAKDIKAQHNSTHDFMHTLKRYALVQREVRMIKCGMQLYYGSRSSLTHSRRKACQDIFFLARRLLESNLAFPSSSSRRNTFNCADTRSAGLSLLSELVANFNKSFVERDIASNSAADVRGGEPDVRNATLTGLPVSPSRSPCEARGSDSDKIARDASTGHQESVGKSSGAAAAAVYDESLTDFFEEDCDAFGPDSSDDDFGFDSDLNALDSELSDDAEEVRMGKEGAAVRMDASYYNSEGDVIWIESSGESSEASDAGEDE